MESFKEDQGPKWLGWISKFKDDWLGFKIDEEETIGDVLEKENWAMRYNNKISGIKKIKFQSAVDGGVLEGYEYGGRGNNLLNFMARRYFENTSAAMNVSYDSGAELYTFRKEGRSTIESEVIVKAIEAEISRGGSHRLSTRYLLSDVENKWIKLYFKTEVRMTAKDLLGIRVPNVNCILLPFLFSKDESGKRTKVQASMDQVHRLSLWVQPKLQESLGIEEIKSEYIRLIEHIDNLMVDSDIWKDAQKR
jgi:hypothetical protein